MNINSSDIPKEIVEYFKCNLLHEKHPILNDGNITWVCKECKIYADGKRSYPDHPTSIISTKYPQG